MGPVAGSCEHGNEYLDSRKCGTFFKSLLACIERPCFIDLVG
jgi:hypothetical protein